MAAFLNNCRFIPTAGGTTDWVYASAVGGCQSPTLAGAIDGRKYKFIAISSDLTQWEIAEGTYTAASGTFTRATVLYNSSGSGVASGQSGGGTRINFAAAPNVAIVAVKEDLISVEEPNAFTTAQMAQARANLGVTKKNYVVNGGMMVSQENGTTAGTANGFYPVDQWIVDLSTTTGAVSAAQVASRTPGGSPNRIRVTVTAAQATIGSSYCILRQPLEGSRIADLLQGTASAKAVTISLGVKAPAGTYSVNLLAGDFGTSSSGSITVAAGEANTDVIKTVTFPGMTTGNFPTGNVVAAQLQVVLAQAGSFNLYGTNGNVFELFDVGIYEGASAPSFQLPDFASEFRLCQRYWEKTYDYGTAKGTATPNGKEWVFSSSIATQAGKSVSFATAKRTNPTMTFYSPNSGIVGNAYDYQAATDVAVNIDNAGDHGFAFYVNKSNLATNVGVHWIANARM